MCYYKIEENDLARKDWEKSAELGFSMAKFWLNHYLKIKTESTPVSNKIKSVDKNISFEILSKSFSENEVNEGVIKNIFIGLPHHLIQRVHWVERMHRIHPYSFIPGGVDIVVEYLDSSVLAYDWVKYPYEYISKIVSDLERIEVKEFKLMPLSEQLTLTKKSLCGIYYRKVEKLANGEFKISKYEEAWNSSSKNMPRNI